MNYRTIADLNRAIVDNLHRLPRGLTAVAGIPRSGLLAANIVALHLNLPLAELSGLPEGRFIGSGRRLKLFRGENSALNERVLLVDDSICRGKAMAEARQFLATHAPQMEVIYSAVYAASKSVSKVDFYFELCEMPRMFEWNLMHHLRIQRSCVDIDGVLCRDPKPEENDDGPNYERFLATVEPLIVPTVEIGWLVTCRLEKYRDLTAAWMARHGIRYKNLVMMNYSTKAERKAAGQHADFKAKVYTDTEAVLFVESSSRQAAKIAKLTGKHVFCMETREMVTPDNWAKARRLVYDQSSWGRFRLRKIFRLGKRKVSSPAFE